MRQPNRKPRAARTIDAYLRIPTPKGPSRKEFWSADRIEYMRELSETGHAVIKNLEDAARYAAGSRSLRDRIRLNPVRKRPMSVGTPDIGAPLNGFNGTRPIALAAPLVWGDMSFGAIHAEAVKALVKSAEATGILSGTGEGGLHPDIRQYKRFNVQWASARFGVDLDTLKSGSAIFIKIGQGAKPGIGGHLPGMKVVGDIPPTRRIPEGRDAISPAPHHDIYSIEDLGQRIWALKVATGQPVYVKVAATNYVPYVACGIARMGGDGVVIDGHLAGTGATPEVIRDNVGIPIELAVASSDQMLREQTMDGEPLRNRVSIIAGGGVTSSTDILKLVALGADACMMGTGALVAMGCVMVHKCHTGKCPTALATQTPHRLLDVDWATKRCIDFVNGLKEEMGLLLDELGYDSMSELVGDRSALRGFDLNEETLAILGVAVDESKKPGMVAGFDPTEERIDFWTPWRIEHIDANAETGEAVITSMGSLSPPFVEPPRVICDWLRSDGAQVTRPSVDPYREEIETIVYLANGATRLAAPCFFDLSRYRTLPDAAQELIVRTAAAVGALAMVTPQTYTAKMAKFGRALILDISDDPNDIPEDAASVVAGFILDDGAERSALPSRVAALKEQRGKPVFIRTAPIRNIHRRVARLAEAGVDAIIVRDETDAETGDIICDLSSDQHYPLEIALSIADSALRANADDNGSVAPRRRVSLLASSERVRGADDIFKMIALGADAVGIGDAALIAAVKRTASDVAAPDAEIDFAATEAAIRLENFYWATQKELKLLLGAAGASSATTLLGSRELLRAVDLDPAARQLLDVKPAGR